MKEGAVSQPSDFVDTLPDSADELEVVVLAERQKLKRSLDELNTTVRERLDVRTRLWEHPLLTVGAAAAAGAVVGVLSNRTSHHPRTQGQAHLGAAFADAAPRRESNQVFGKMALTIATLVGQRLADMATDGVRKTLAPRTTGS